MRILISGCGRLTMDALEAALQSFGFTVFATASARDLSASLPVEVVLIGSDGMAARVIANIEACRTRFPNAPIVLYGADHSERDIMTFIESGARAYTPSNIPLEELMRVIKTVTAGETSSSGRLTAMVTSRIAALAKAQREAATNAALTAREQQVLRLIRAGLSNKEIGQELSISSNTVKIHVHRVLEKLHIRRRHEAYRCTFGTASVS